MENINSYLDGLTALGVPKAEQFQTVDLYEAKNIVQVIDSFYSLSRHAIAHGYKGASLGPKLSDKNERTFTDEQINEGKKIIGLQMGFTGGANASGINHGARRDIGPKKVIG